MRQSLLVLVTLTFMIGFGGCAGPQTDEPASDASVAQQSTPQSRPQSESNEEAIESEPESLVLGKEEAGALFLDVICGVNAPVYAYNDAIAVAEDQYYSGVAPDMSQVNFGAQSHADAMLQGITVFDDTYYVWPESVAPLVQQIRDGFMTMVGPLRQLENATDYETFVSVVVPSPEMPSQEIRYQLGLDSNPTTSCVGHEDKLSGLAAESQERADARG